ncbi:hypothetical protein QTN47_19675 [Danxiaibacter flavus]|uniref:Uncharacterized protein n=1 Tax=Danxiaibacter flavus TaxID=3049108 RepID=A0ABV3ZJJ0_9BACT|nr:hypothetical protein QNM32_19685 [Chitinophagaceae bacterium DXS]
MKISTEIMLDGHYYLNASTDFTSFEFDSIGPRGIIRKVVLYTELHIRSFFNLAFGDKDVHTGLISDLTVSNNNDSEKVLATVAATLYLFTEYYPNATVIASGSTDARTRLYRIGISNNLVEIQKDFIIMGLCNGGWESFCKDQAYTSFLVRRKP